MQIQKGKRPGEASSKARGDLIRKKRRSRKDGGPKAGAAASQKRGIGFHLLASTLRTIPLFEVAMLTDHDENLERGIVSMIDTEAKQLKAIEDLYAIVKAQPRYQNLKEPSWSADASPITVIYWLLRKLGPLATGDRWTVDTYRSASKRRFRFVVYRNYHRQHVPDREEYMPLDFLPSLLKRDKALHGLIIDVVALVSRQNKVPLWDEDGDFSETMKILIDQPQTGNSILDAQKCSYKNGLAAYYLRTIKQRRKKVQLGALKRQLNNYDAASDRKGVIKWWLGRGIRLAETGKNIHTNTFVPNYTPGNPITPFRLYKFVWSMHQNDAVRARSFGRLEKDDKYGTFLPVEFTIVKPGEILKPIETDHYPEMLYEFMRTGVANLMWRYKDYFYKKQMEDQMTPSEQLLEKIELSEIKNLSRA